MEHKEKSTKINGLQLKQIRTRPKTIETLDPVSYLMETVVSDGFVVAYLDYAVWIGRFSPQQGFVFHNREHAIDKTYLQRIRVFNGDIEFLLWRTGSGNQFKGRVRRDGEGEEKKVVDAQQVLFGTRAKPMKDNKEFSMVTEQRGTRLILPFSNLDVDDKKNRVCIKTRHYIAYNEWGQAGYEDSRFLCFTNHDDILT